MKRLFLSLAVCLSAFPAAGLACGEGDESMGYRWVTMRGQGFYIIHHSRRLLVTSAKIIQTAPAYGALL